VVSGLVEFLRARLDEDEQAARAAAGLTVDAQGYEEVLTHLQRWGSARVLAEVEAKRRIVDLHLPTTSEYHLGKTDEDGYGTVNPVCPTCGTPDEYAVQAPCPTLRLLALPYAGHPDYRAEWAP
jgi:hypothetical protein